MKRSRDSVPTLNRDIVACERCKRLRTYCKAVASEKKRAHRDEVYWGKPVPNFSDSAAKLLIIGLAPAAHGANRTGRMFTGDRSGQWLYRALHRAGFANQSSYQSADDGLRLQNCAITAVAHCAPPDNKPMPDEIDHCSEYLARTFALYQPRVVVCLGGIAWKAAFAHLKKLEVWKASVPPFSHLAEVMCGEFALLGSYHPSQQNTFTGRLTEPMFDAVFARANELLLGPRQRADA